MAVVVQYIVVRNGVEKMTFATKKEADAHDKMLDIADNLSAFLRASDIKLDDDQNEKISLLLAQERDTVNALLRGAKPPKAATAQEEKPKERTPGKKKAAQKSEPKPKGSKKKPSASKAAA